VIRSAWAPDLCLPLSALGMVRDNEPLSQSNIPQSLTFLTAPNRS